MRKMLLCLFLVVGACGDDEPLPPDATVAAADAAPPDAAVLPDAPLPDATPPDASIDPVPCGHAYEACCRLNDSCGPGLGCVSSVPLSGVCVPLDGGP